MSGKEATSAAAEPSAAPARTTSSSSSSSSRRTIRLHDNVLLKLPSGVLKPIKVTPNGTVSLGKYGSFKSHLLVGNPYGHTYEVDSNSKIHPIQVTLNDVEETEANNQLIMSTGAQSLTFDDIQALKESGLTGREIIQKQIDEHKAFELKTEYSKDKYLKRKQAKYLQLFTPLEPTVNQVAEYHFDRQPSKTRELRPDTLANLLAMANVRPGSRLLVVEDLGGMIVGAAVERMAGQGRIMVVNDADSPPDLHILDQFNFSPADLAPIASLHWAATQPEWSPPDLPLGETASATAEDDPSAAGERKPEENESTVGATATEAQTGTKPLLRKNNRESMKLKKRRATFEKAREARDDFFRGEFDGVIIASEYEPYSIIERLLPRIAGSAPVVVFSHHMQVLHPALQSLRSHNSFVAPTIREPFLRRYQVLPGRTHPEMQGMASGGLILSCVRVLENEEAQAVNVAKRGKKRAAAAVTNAAAGAATMETPSGSSEEKTVGTAGGAQASERGDQEPAQKKVKTDANGEASAAVERIPDVDAAEGMQVDAEGPEAS